MHMQSNNDEKKNIDFLTHLQEKLPLNKCFQNSEAYGSYIYRSDKIGVTYYHDCTVRPPHSLRISSVDTT